MANKHWDGNLGMRGDRVDRMCRACFDLGMQEMFDMMLITLNHEFGFGYKRIQELNNRLGDLNEIFKIAGDYKHPEADYARQRIDDMLREFIPAEDFVPWPARYPDYREAK